LLKHLSAALFAALLAMPLPAATTFTGDRIDGTPVIDRLDVSDLAEGQVHRFWFRATDNSIGQAWYVPVVVVRGAKPGPRLLLTAAIHGDELNGIDVIHKLAATIDPASLSGTLVGVPGLNTPGLLHRTRGFTPGDGRDGENLNRIMPGDDKGDDAAELYAHRLWTGLLRPNADTAIDLHTQSIGTAYVFYAFAANQRARRIAELIAPDILKLDPGVKGTVELEMIRAGVPAITLELARPEEFDPLIVQRAVEGIGRVMVDMRMLAPGSAPPAVVTPFVGNKLVQVRARRGGFARILVRLGDAVDKGQEVATISDAFGRVLETVRAPESGRVNTVATTPLRDPGGLLMRIVFVSPDPKCSGGC
jgi:predicted deacylase